MDHNQEHPPLMDGISIKVFTDTVYDAITNKTRGFIFYFLANYRRFFVQRI